MSRRTLSATFLACALCAASGASARAQWGYPGGYGGFGWGGWGGGGGATVQGDIARGMGVFAAGAGIYNEQTAIANAINADTVKRWNEYMYQSQLERNRRFWARQDRNLAANIKARNAIQDRLRNNPEQRDVFRGDAMNVALDEINDPRIYVRALRGASVKVGGDMVRAIPFQYASAGITMGIHQLATGTLPAPLRTPAFEADMKAIRALDEEILKQIDEDKQPDAETVKKLLAAIVTAEEKATKTFPANSLDAKQAQRYLMGLHGLVVMLKAPVLDPYLAGVEKKPDLTLADLLSFMTAFNLRFAPATTPQQREAYSSLYPRLVQLRDQVALAEKVRSEAATLPPGAAESFFSGMTVQDLNKRPTTP